MSFSSDDLNYIFTREGHQESIDYANDVPEGFVLPNAAPDGSQQASSQPAQGNAGVVSENLQNDPRFEQISRQLQGVVQERDTYRQQLGQINQQQFINDQQALARAVEAETDPKKAVAMVQQNAAQIIQTLARENQQTQDQMRQALVGVLIDGFTQTEVFAKYPNLTDEQKSLLTALPDPDQRAQFAAVFNEIGNANQQNAAASAAALHVASGAGRVGGVAPNGGTATATQPGHNPGRPKSAYDVLRETPYLTGGYPGQQ